MLITLSSVLVRCRDLILILKCLLFSFKICVLTITHGVCCLCTFLALTDYHHFICWRIKFKFCSFNLVLENNKRLHLFILCHFFPFCSAITENCGIWYIFVIMLLLDQKWIILRRRYIRNQFYILARFINLC